MVSEPALSNCNKPGVIAASVPTELAVVRLMPDAACAARLAMVMAAPGFR